MNDICEKCGGVKQNKNLMIVVGNCRDCGSQINIAAMVDDNERLLYGPIGFDKNELELAKTNNVIIENRYSKTASDTYPVNVCTNNSCNSFVGEFYLFMEHIQPAFDELNEFKLIPVGTFCEQCDL